MNRQCLICESRAVMPRDAAKGLTLLVGLVDGALQGARSTSSVCSHGMFMSGLAAIAPTYPAALDAAEDFARFHFGGFEFLCLRCGTRFDAAVMDQESLNCG